MSTQPAHTWQEQAACAGLDAELFFPEEQGGSATAQQAKQVCAGCPVRNECLAYAVRHNIEHGVWGGTTEKDRRRMGPGRPTTRCGTRTGYLNGCRCDPCKNANKLYQRKWRQTTRISLGERHNLHGPGGRFVKRTPDDAA